MVGGEGAVAVFVSIFAIDVFVGGDEESGGAAGGVEDGFVLLWVDELDHEVDDVARGAELPGIALRAKDGEEVFEGIAEAFGVVVFELVDDLEEALEGLGIAVWKVGVLKMSRKRVGMPAFSGILEMASP